TPRGGATEGVTGWMMSFGARMRPHPGVRAGRADRGGPWPDRGATLLVQAPPGAIGPEQAGGPSSRRNQHRVAWARGEEGRRVDVLPALEQPEMQGGAGTTHGRPAGDELPGPHAEGEQPGQRRAAPVGVHDAHHEPAGD